MSTGKNLQKIVQNYVWKLHTLFGSCVCTKCTCYQLRTAEVVYSINFFDTDQPINHLVTPILISARLYKGQFQLCSLRTSSSLVHARRVTWPCINLIHTIKPVLAVHSIKQLTAFKKMPVFCDP